MPTDRESYEIKYGDSPNNLGVGTGVRIVAGRAKKKAISKGVKRVGEGIQDEANKSESENEGGVPFKMKAADYGNSPIQKNFGSPMQRGFSGGVGSKETDKLTSVGPFDYKDSPAKGFWDGLQSVFSPKHQNTPNPPVPSPENPVEEQQDTEENVTTVQANPAAATAQTGGKGDLESRITALENKAAGGVEGGADATIMEGAQKAQIAKAGQAAQQFQKTKAAARAGAGGVGGGMVAAGIGGAAQAPKKKKPNLWEGIATGGLSLFT